MFSQITVHLLMTKLVWISFLRVVQWQQFLWCDGLLPPSGYYDITLPSFSFSLCTGVPSVVY